MEQKRNCTIGLSLLQSPDHLSWLLRATSSSFWSDMELRSIIISNPKHGANLVAVQVSADLFNECVSPIMVMKVEVICVDRSPNGYNRCWSRGSYTYSATRLFARLTGIRVGINKIKKDESRTYRYETRNDVLHNQTERERRKRPPKNQNDEQTQDSGLEQTTLPIKTMSKWT